MAIHHRSVHLQFVLSQIEHIKRRILAKYRHYNDGTPFFDTLHKRTNTRLNSSNLKRSLKIFIPEKPLRSFFERRLSYIERIYYTTFTSYFKPEITHIGNKNPFGSSCLSELRHEVTDRSGTRYNHILTFQVPATHSCMRSHCHRFYHSPIIK